MHNHQGDQEEQIQRASASANVALVRPPILQLARSLSSYGPILPIGLAYVAAVLRDGGHRIQVIDGPGEALSRVVDVKSPIGLLRLSGLTPDEIVAKLDPDTQFLGITHMFLHEWPTVLEIAEKAKARIPTVVVILGGENASAFYQWIFKQTEAVDYCVLGEGEATALELIACHLAGQDSSQIPGVACRKVVEGRPIAPRQRLTRLDSIPRPAWELLPVRAYLEHSDYHGVHRGRSMPMVATRGCPYQCTFCSSPKMWTTRYAVREAGEVVQEILDYQQLYRVQNINFCDLTAIISREWIVAFCEILLEKKLDITWQLPTGTRSEALDDEVLQLLYRSGCRNITYAPESGSTRMLKVLKKKVKIPRMLDSLRTAYQIGLVTRVNIIIGHPLEKRKDTLLSLAFLIRAALLGCQDAAVMVFSPYPGSADFDNLLSQGKVEFTDDFYYLALKRAGRSSKTYNPTMGTTELIAWQLGMLIIFYATAYLTHPWRLFQVLKNLVTGREQTLLDQLLRTKLKWTRGIGRKMPDLARP